MPYQKLDLINLPILKMNQIVFYGLATKNDAYCSAVIESKFSLIKVEFEAFFRQSIVDVFMLFE